MVSSTHFAATAERGPESASVLVLRLQPTRYPYVCANIARTLGRMGVEVYLLHADARAPDSRSRWLRRSIRMRRSGHELETLLSLGPTIARGARPILIAADDPAAFFVDQHAEALASAYCFPRQPPGLVRALADKAMMHDLCVELGLATPSVRTVRPQDTFDDIDASLSYPVVLKVADPTLRRTRSTAIAWSRGELLRHARDMQADGERTNLLVQEYVPGGAESAWIFGGYFGEGSDLLFGGAARKLRQYPADAGVTSLGVCEPQQRIHALTRQLAEATGFRGLIDIDFRYDCRDETFKILDVNPRVGHQFRLLAGASGGDVVRAMYLDLSGRPLETDAPVTGRRWIVENYDLRSAIPAVARGDLSLRRWIDSLRGVAEGAWFARDDLGPFAAMVMASLSDVARLVGSRAGRTMASMVHRRP
jgi:D-aspartate ligase